MTPPIATPPSVKDAMPDIVSVNFDEILMAFERDTIASRAKDRFALEDECVLAAQRGWHACSPSVAWPIAAEGAVREYFREDLTDDVITTHKRGASSWALFASYAIGWLFSLKGQGRLDELSADNAFAVLPGFMWLETVRIYDAAPPAE